MKLIAPARIAFWMLASAIAPASFADDPASIDLRGTLRPAPHGWTLSVRYDVEVKRRLAREPLELRIDVTDARAPIPTPDGPLALLEPLDRVCDDDDDETEFCGRLTVELPPDAIVRPSRVKLHAVLARPGAERGLAYEDQGVELLLPPPPPPVCVRVYRW